MKPPSKFFKPFAGLLAVAALAAPAAHADPIPVKVRLAPALAPGVWVKGTPTTIAAQKGKVVVLLFWTRECINCKHNLPFWNDWARRYRGTDVTVLSVHTPELPAEHSIGAARSFSRSHVDFPVVTDNGEHTWDAYGVQAWPTEVLIDKRGRVRNMYDGEVGGDGENKVILRRIEQLRAEA